jgi:hypothetical protein
MSGFAQALMNPIYAFFDLRAPDDATPPVETILQAPVLFRICVMKYAVTEGLWPVLGERAPTAEVMNPPWFFKQDPLSGALSISTDGGEGVPATPEQCQHMERASVWDPEHVVSRLEDHFAGRPNKWVELQRLK